jgi:hypothetical protein
MGCSALEIISIAEDLLTTRTYFFNVTVLAADINAKIALIKTANEVRLS